MDKKATANLNNSLTLIHYASKTRQPCCSATAFDKRLKNKQSP